jgi:hypothetical protein
MLKKTLNGDSVDENLSPHHNRQPDIGLLAYLIVGK